MINIKQLTTESKNFQQELKAVLAWDASTDTGVADIVKAILTDVKTRGDAAVLDYSRQFDHVVAESMGDLELSLSDAKKALGRIPVSQRTALEAAASRVRSYHEHQKQESWTYTEADGTVLGQQITPLDRAGLYVPGGKASYPSSVLMNAIPAKVAGVDELIMVVPTPGGEVNDLVLAAAAIVGVDRIFAIGGAQAVAALAYGTETIPQVDKIVGPGNIYVSTAKGMVFGAVGIDMIAGPSEHDEDAQSILISPDAEFLQAVHEAINRLLPSMEREAIIKTSLSRRGALIQVKSMDDAIDVINFISPEHLELSVDNPMVMAKKVRHAGAIFMGRYTAEALGDYCAGPNHVLPTSRTARFSSPLGVYDFQKRSSLIQVSKEGTQNLGQLASVLARGEGLTAHARSAEYRIKD